MKFTFFLLALLASQMMHNLARPSKEAADDEGQDSSVEDKSKEEDSGEKEDNGKKEDKDKEVDNGGEKSEEEPPTTQNPRFVMATYAGKPCEIEKEFKAVPEVYCIFYTICHNKKTDTLTCYNMQFDEKTATCKVIGDADCKPPQAPIK